MEYVECKQITIALSENLGLQKFLRVSYSREAIKESNLHFLSLFRRTVACQTLMSEMICLTSKILYGFCNGDNLLLTTVFQET